MSPRHPADNTYERGRWPSREASGRPKRREVRVSALQQLVPMFFVIQFVVVLVGLVTAMVFADPQLSLAIRPPTRRARVRR